MANGEQFKRLFNQSTGQMLTVHPVYASLNMLDPTLLPYDEFSTSNHILFSQIFAAEGLTIPPRSSFVL
jgi:hypothetical protein